MGWEGEGVLAPSGYAFKPRSVGTTYREGVSGEMLPRVGRRGVSVIPAPQSQLSTPLRSEWKDQSSPNLLISRIFFLWVCTNHECSTHFRERSLSYFLSIPGQHPRISLQVSDDTAQAFPPAPDFSRRQQRRGPL